MNLDINWIYAVYQIPKVPNSIKSFEQTLEINLFNKMSVLKYGKIMSVDKSDFSREFALHATHDLLVEVAAVYRQMCEYEKPMSKICFTHPGIIKIDSTDLAIQLYVRKIRSELNQIKNIKKGGDSAMDGCNRNIFDKVCFKPLIKEEDKTVNEIPKPANREVFNYRIYDPIGGLTAFLITPTVLQVYEEYSALKSTSLYKKVSHMQYIIYINIELLQINNAKPYSEKVNKMIEDLTAYKQELDTALAKLKEDGKQPSKKEAKKKEVPQKVKDMWSEQQNLKAEAYEKYNKKTKDTLENDGVNRQLTAIEVQMPKEIFIAGLVPRLNKAGLKWKQTKENENSFMIIINGTSARKRFLGIGGFYGLFTCWGNKKLFHVIRCMPEFFPYGRECTTIEIEKYYDKPIATAKLEVFTTESDIQKNFEFWY